MDRFQELTEMVNSLEEDFGKFYDKSNKAAGTRIRVGLQNIKNHAQLLRKEVQDMKNSES